MTSTHCWGQQYWSDDLNTLLSVSRHTWGNNAIPRPWNSTIHLFPLERRQMHVNRTTNNALFCNPRQLSLPPTSTKHWTAPVFYPVIPDSPRSWCPHSMFRWLNWKTRYRALWKTSSAQRRAGSMLPFVHNEVPRCSQLTLPILMIMRRVGRSGILAGIWKRGKNSCILKVIQLRHESPNTSRYIYFFYNQCSHQPVLSELFQAWQPSIFF